MSSEELTIPCTFQGVSNADGTDTAIGIKCARGIMSDEKMIAMFCGSVLECEIAFDPAKQEDSAQLTLGGDDGEVKIDAIAESPRITIKPDSVSVRIVFAIADVELDTLARFPKCVGTIKCRRVGDAGKKEGE